MPTYKDENTGKWFCQLWYTNWKGERKHKVKRGFDKKRDADKWEKEFKAHQTASNLTMDIAIQEFEEYLENRVTLGIIKPTTRDHRKSDIHYYIKPYFENSELQMIKPKHVTEWLAFISTKKQKMSAAQPKRLSSNTLRSAMDTLSLIFKFAEKNHNFKYNPVLDAERPAKYTTNLRTKCWTAEQYATFYSHLQEPMYKLAFNILFFAGLRTGEMLALRPIDFSETEITVKRNRVLLRDGTTLDTTPKTPTSVRAVPIPSFLYKQFKEYIDTCYGLKEDDCIFTFNGNNLRAKMRHIVYAAKLPLASPHTLRHSYASIRYNITKDFTIVSHDLGHSNPSITASIYSHMLETDKRNGVAELENLKPNSEKEAQ